MTNEALEARAPPETLSVSSANLANSTCKRRGMDGSAAQGETSATESEGEEDIVYQMRGLRGLGAAPETVASRQRFRDKKDNASFVPDYVVSPLKSRVILRLTEIPIA